MMVNQYINEDDISKRIEHTLTTLDQQRIQGLDVLKLLQNNQNAALEKEQARLTQKYGENHPRVQAIATRLTYNERFFPALDREIERSKIEVPSVDRNTWLVHGRVLNRDNVGISDLTISLSDENSRWVRQLNYACTNEVGYFAITYSVKPQEKPPISETQPLFLTVSNNQQQVLHRETSPVFMKPGLIDERTIILGDKAFHCGTPPVSDGDNTD